MTVMATDESNSSDERHSHPPSKDFGDRVLDAWQHPRFSFLIGLLVGIMLVGMIMFAPPNTFQHTSATDIGNNVVSHFQERAPTGLDYSLNRIDHYGSGLYRVELTVKRGNITSNEAVYATDDGKWVFTRIPEHIQPQLSQ